MRPAPTLQCPCGEADLDLAYAYDRPPPGEILFGTAGPYAREYRRCRRCGHFFARYAMAVADPYGGAYVDATYGDAARMRARFEAILALPPERSDNHGRVARVCAFADRHLPPGPAPRSLLDVGAGLGVFPAAMRRRGWTVTALDPDPRNERHYREAVGATPLIGDLFAVAPERLGRHHLVTLNKVLEHVPDPAAMLRRVRPAVAAGGFLYLEVPDVAAAAEGPGREEFGFGHDHVFTPASTALLVERAGFAVAEIRRLREPSSKYTLCAFAVP